MDSISTYLQRRATEERDAAERATDDKAREIHLELAARYADAAASGATNAAGVAAEHSEQPRVLHGDLKILR